MNGADFGPPCVLDMLGCLTTPYLKVLIVSNLAALMTCDNAADAADVD